MRRRLIVATVLLMASPLARAQESIPSASPNCDLTSPPAQSGLVPVMHTGFFKVFPRRSDMPRDYTGCQAVWSVQSELHRGQPITYRKETLFYFERGVLVVARHEPTGRTCLCRDGTSTTNAAECRVPEGADVGAAIPFSSAPPGCLEEVVASQKVPKRCEEMD